MRYRRAQATGGTYFFTVALAERQATLLTDQVAQLRTTFAEVRRRHPFEIVAIVVLPEHLHAIWTLPAGDMNYPMRWSLIKAGFSRAIPKGERIRDSRLAKRERGIWQRRYWEHQVRDESDLQKHVDYVHYNPVKHGYVNRPADWPNSSIHRYIRMGWLDQDWGSNYAMEDEHGEFSE